MLFFSHSSLIYLHHGIVIKHTQQCCSMIASANTFFLLSLQVKLEAKHRKHKVYFLFHRNLNLNGNWQEANRHRTNHSSEFNGKFCIE